MKKANYLMPLLLMLALLFATTAYAHDFEVDGIYYIIRGVHYFNENGTELTVTYRGYSYNAYSDNYSGSITIPATVTYNGKTYSVTSIGWDAFRDCKKLTKVTIPNSVISIRDRAFSGCTGLSNFEIPSSVISIGKNAFENTAWYGNQQDGLIYSGLVAYKYKGSMPEGTSITLRNGTLGIAAGAFSDCSGLSHIDLPQSLINIGENAFSGCSGLTRIDFPHSLTYIDYWAFSGCSSLTSISIPDDVAYIGASAFEGCTSLETLNYNAVSCFFEVDVGWPFGGLNISTINIGDKVQNIPSYFAAGLQSLTNIIIPNSVTTIGSYAFSGTAWFDNQPNGLVYAGLVAYKYKGTMPEGTSITLKEGTIGIAEEAFSRCSSLTSIHIPNSVTNIGNETFYGCSSLTNIDIPNSVTSIGYYAFYGCSNLTNINIPNSVTKIGSGTFYNCFSLTTINIPNSVTSIGYLAFKECSSLNDIYCYATTPPKCNDYTFSDYSATLHVPAASLAAYFTAPIWCNFENIVGDAVAPTGIAISRDSVEIQSGKQIELTATVTPANASCKEVTWYSTDTNVATVEDGVVTAVGYGECDIFAYCMGMPVVCHITVANRICLGLQEAMLLPNHMLTLTPSAPAMPAGFTVTSSDPTVAATRVMSGKVQIVGIKEGTTTITVASTNGTAQPATCLVTVYTESGDLNSDGFVNISDVTSLIDYLLGGDESSITTKNADVNGDGNINIADVTLLIDSLLSKTE